MRYREPAYLGENDRYEVGQLVAEGGTARVYLAFDTVERTWRAVKVLRGEVKMRADVRKRLKAEAEAMYRLSHPNILRVFDWEVRGQNAWMVMEYAERHSAGRWVDNNGAMPTGAALEVIRQVCVGLKHAHSQGVIHRDIKPHNVLIDGRGICVLADFGIAAILDSFDTRITNTGTALGTLGYMAPEQLDSARSVDERADVYSLGAMLFHLLVAHEPADLFFTAARSEKLSEFPDAVRNIVIRATNHKPSARYPSVEAMAEDIAAVMADHPLPADFTLLQAPSQPTLPANFSQPQSSGPPTFNLDDPGIQTLSTGADDA